MSTWAPHSFRRAAQEAGVGADLIERASAYAGELAGRGLAPVFTLAHLARLVGVEWSYLRSVVSRVHDPYRRWQVKKRRGGYRQICAPEPLLMTTQRWILENIVGRVDPHRAACAYREGRGILDAASPHAGNAWIVKIDLLRFFESIDEVAVFRLFRHLGYESLISFEMSRIVTLLPKFMAGFHYDSKYLAIHPYVVVGRGHLPQGAPTSPAISNLVCVSLDGALASVARDAGGFYTRYSDDMTFSLGPGATRRKAGVLAAQAIDVLRRFGLQANHQKTSIRGPGQRRIILGLLVDEQSRVRLTRKRRAEFRQHLHFIKKVGLVAHARRRRFLVAESLLSHLRGLIAYARSVDPRWAEEAERGLDDALAAAPK